MHSMQMHRLDLRTLIVTSFLEFQRIDQFHANKWTLNLFLLCIFLEIRWKVMTNSMLQLHTFALQTPISPPFQCCRDNDK